MAKKKPEAGQEAGAQNTEAPKKAYEGGEVAYWLKGDISNDDSPLIRNAKRVFNEQTITHVENDDSVVANIKYAMLTDAAAPAEKPHSEANSSESASTGTPAASEAGGNFIPPVGTPTSQGNEGERANNSERTPSGRSETQPQ